MIGNGRGPHWKASPPSWSSRRSSPTAASNSARRGGVFPIVPEGRVPFSDRNHDTTGRELVERRECGRKDGQDPRDRIRDSGGEEHALGHRGTRAEQRECLAESRLGVRDPESAEPELLGAPGKGHRVAGREAWHQTDVDREAQAVTGSSSEKS